MVEEEQQANNRPLSVTLLSLGVFILACTNLLRAIEAFSHWGSLAGLPGISPLYLALTGLLWVITGFPVALALWMGMRSSGWAARLFALAYTLYFWIDRLLVARSALSPDREPSLPFSIVLNLILLVFVLGVLSRRKVRLFIGELHDQRSENSKVGRAAG